MFGRNMIAPRKLKIGNHVALFAPSGNYYNETPDLIQSGVQIIEKWGFKVVNFDSYILNKWRAWVSPIERANEIHKILSQPQVCAAIAVCGGKNSNDLLPILDYELIRNCRKPILGASDTGVILNAVAARAGLITFFGPNLVAYLNETKENGLPLVCPDCAGQFGLQLLPENIVYTTIREGKSEGRLVGGSLGTFTLGLSGTPYFPAFENVIFFFESGTLDLLRVRQHLQNLKLTGALNHVSGLLVGAMTAIKKHNDDIDAMLRETFTDPSIPILRGDFIGHGNLSNPTLPIGANVRLQTNPPQLTTLEPVVE